MLVSINFPSADLGPCNLFLRTNELSKVKDCEGKGKRQTSTHKSIVMYARKAYYNRLEY